MENNKHWGKSRCILCTKKRAAKGVCSNHYIWMRRLVKREKTTWKLLERAGLVLPARKQNENPLKEFMSYFKS